MIVLAGGSGTRMGTDGNKVYRTVGGRPLLAYPLAACEAADVVDDVVVVVRAGDESDVAPLVAGCSKVRAVVPGGATRTGSEHAGLAALGARADDDVVAVHDGARPFLTVALLAELVAAARRHGAAVPALAAPPLLRVDGDRLVPCDDGPVVHVQTPQVFLAGPLLAAYRTAAASGAEGADTAETVAAAGGPAAHVVVGDPRNLKVTTPADLPVAEAYAACWADGVWVDQRS